MQWQQLLLKRDPDTYKYDYGHVLVIGGSPGLTGAVCLTALGALRIGAGLVSVGVPADLSHIFEIKLTDVMSLNLDSKAGVLSSKSFSRIKDFIEQRKVSVVAIGPGLSNTLSTRQLVKAVVKGTDLPTIIDADGINALSSDPEILEHHGAELILTPHLGEFSRLIKKPVSQIKEKRKAVAKEFACRHKLTLVLKGNRTIVTDGKTYLGNNFENNTGNPGMATAGSGDVLTGIIAGLIAQSKASDIFEAVKLGVSLHGLAGDMAAQDKTQGCLIASDIIDYLPQAVKSLKKSPA